MLAFVLGSVAGFCHISMGFVSHLDDVHSSTVHDCLKLLVIVWAQREIFLKYFNIDTVAIFVCRRIHMYVCSLALPLCN